MLRFARAAALPSVSEDWKETCRTVYPSLFYIRKDTLVVSGFFVGQRGVGVSVHHILEQAKGQWDGAKLMHNGRAYDFEIVHRSPSRDVIIIHVKDGSQTLFPFLRISLEKMEIGDQVLAFGTNGRLVRCFAPGYVLDPAYNLMKTVSFPCLRCSNRAEAGYSGGPITLPSGHVIAMHKAETNLFEGIKDSASVPISEILSVLKEVAVETEQGWELK